MRQLISILPLALVLCLSCGDDDEILTSEHEGWQNPVCDDCHDHHHNSDLDLYECAECHGGNGAPEQPLSVFHTVSCGDAAAGGPGCHEGKHGGEDAGFPSGVCADCHAQETAQ